MIREMTFALTGMALSLSAWAAPPPMTAVPASAELPPLERAVPHGDAERLMAEAADLSVRGRIDEARQRWEQVALDHAKSPQAPAALLSLAQSEEDLYLALRWADQIISDHPESAEVEQARLLEGEIFHLLGDYTNAAAVYADYLSHHPRGESVPLARERLITGLIESGQPEEALAEWDRQYQTDRAMGSDLASLMQRADALIALERWEEAADLLRQVTARYPNRDQTPRAHLAAGLCLESLSRWDEAAEVYGMLARQWPQSTEGRMAAERLAAIVRFQRAVAQMR